MFGFLFMTFNCLLALIGIGGLKIRDAIENEEAKQKAIKAYENGDDMSGIYSSYNSNSDYLGFKDIFTDKNIIIKTNEYGDRIAYTWNKYSGKEIFVRNISQLERENKWKKNKEKAIKNNRTVYEYMTKDEYKKLRDIKVKNGEIPKDKACAYADGHRYKDINTGEIYVKRRIYIAPNKYNDGNRTAFTGVDTSKYTMFYMNANTKELVRRTDEQIKSDKINGDSNNAIKIADTDNFIKLYNNNYIDKFGFGGFYKWHKLNKNDYYSYSILICNEDL